MKRWGMVIVVAAGMGAWFFTPLSSWFSREHVNDLQAWIASWGMWAPAVFIGLYVAATVLMAPGSVLTIAAGMIFGVWRGTIIALMAATLGAMAAFLVGRYVAQEAVQKRLAGRGVRLNERIARQGFSIVVWCRLIPLIPFNLFNYACSLTAMSLKDFVLGSVVGMIPGALAFVSIGSAVANHAWNDGRVWSRVEVWGPFVLLAILMALPKLFGGARNNLQQIMGGTAEPDRKD